MPSLLYKHTLYILRTNPDQEKKRRKSGLRTKKFFFYAIVKSKKWKVRDGNENRR
jgi:hypothetical protein